MITLHFSRWPKLNWLHFFQDVLGVQPLKKTQNKEGENTVFRARLLCNNKHTTRKLFSRAFHNCAQHIKLLSFKKDIEF
jgi:hypothetical protein